MDTIDVHKTPVTAGSVAKTLGYVSAIFIAGYLTNKAIVDHDTGLVATLVTKKDLEEKSADIKNGCITACITQVLATIGKDGFKCRAIRTRGENYDKCDLAWKESTR